MCLNILTKLLQANIGELDDKASRYGILLGNIALLQVQATLVSFVAACLSFVLGLVMPRPGVSAVEASAAAESFSLLFSRRPRPTVPFDPRKPKSGLIEYVVRICQSDGCLGDLQVHHGCVNRNDVSVSFKSDPWFLHVHSRDSLS